MTKAFGGITLAVALLAYRTGGPEMVWRGLQRGLSTLGSVALLVAAAYVVAGLVEVMVSQDTIRHLLGREAGWRGLTTAMLVGSITPGGPYVYYPIARAISAAGVGAGTVFAYLTAKGVWDLTRVPMELALLGPRLTLARWLVTFFIPPVVALAAFKLARWLDPFLPSGGDS